MIVALICSVAFYGQVEEIANELRANGHEVIYPGAYNEMSIAESARRQGGDALLKFKQRMYELSEKNIKRSDIVLAINLDENGQKNYIGGSTFLELYEAYRNHKKIYLWNDIPDSNLRDEIEGFGPIVIKGDMSKIV